MSLTLGLALIVLCVLAEAFFSGSELALVSVDRVAIRARRDEGSRTAALLLRFLEDPERILTTTLVGTNLAVVSASTLAALLLAEHAHRTDEWLTVLCLGPVVLIFGEIIPKSLAQRYGDRIAPIIIHPIYALSLLLLPITAAVRTLSFFTFRLLGVEQARASGITREELRLLMEHRQSHEIEEPEREMVRRIFDFPELRVEDVMRPLIDIVAVERDENLADAAEKFRESGFSRLPVYHERVDNIVGVLHALDLVYEDDRARMVADLMLPVTYVPPSQKVDGLLQELQRQRRGLAIVVDEYGGAAGLVTVEDILEEIVGEIEDEHDTKDADIKRRGEREWLVSARVEVDRLNLQIGPTLPEGEYETVAGFLLFRLGRIPKVGDRVQIDGAVLTVAQANARVIEAVHIERGATDADDSGTSSVHPR